MASFEQQVQQWVSVDNQIRVLTEKIHELRDNKNIIGDLGEYNDELTKSLILLSPFKINGAS